MSFGWVRTAHLRLPRRTVSCDGVARQRVLRHVRDGQLLDAVLLLGVGEHGDDARDRRIGAGGEIISPQRVDHFAVRRQHRRPVVRRVAEVAHLAPGAARLLHTVGSPSITSCSRVGSLPATYFSTITRRIGMRSAKRRQQILPVRQTGIGDRPHDDPMVRRLDRQELLDDVRRMIAVGAEDAGKEADIDRGGFRVAQHAGFAQRLDRDRDARELRLAAIGIDPASTASREVKSTSRVGAAAPAGGTAASDDQDGGDTHDCPPSRIGTERARDAAVCGPRCAQLVAPICRRRHDCGED